MLRQLVVLFLLNKKYHTNQSFVFLSSIDSGFVRTERYEVDVLILFLLQPWSTGVAAFAVSCLDKKND